MSKKDKSHSFVNSMFLNNSIKFTIKRLYYSIYNQIVGTKSKDLKMFLLGRYRESYWDVSNFNKIPFTYDYTVYASRMARTL